MGLEGGGLLYAGGEMSRAVCTVALLGCKAAHSEPYKALWATLTYAQGHFDPWSTQNLEAQGWYKGPLPSHKRGAAQNLDLCLLLCLQSARCTVIARNVKVKNTGAMKLSPCLLTSEGGWVQVEFAFWIKVKITSNQFEFFALLQGSFS